MVADGAAAVSALMRHRCAQCAGGQTQAESEGEEPRGHSRRLHTGDSYSLGDAERPVRGRLGVSTDSGLRRRLVSRHS